MGYSIPAAMGAKMADPDLEVWAIDGDGCFQMTNQELATCAIEGIPIKVALINNGNLGMVRQWQTLFYEERYSSTDLATHSRRIPDFVKLAEALGCVAFRVEREEEVAETIAKAREINDRPVLIDFIVGADAQVWPMVAAGTGNDEIMAARGIRPLFDDDEARPLRRQAVTRLRLSRQQLDQRHRLGPLHQLAHVRVLERAHAKVRLRGPCHTDRVARGERRSNDERRPRGLEQERIPRRLKREQARKAFRKSREEIGNVNAELQESIAAVREAQAFNRADENIENFKEVNAANRDANVRAVSFTSALAPTLEALSYVSLAIVTGVGGWYLLKGGTFLGSAVTLGLVVTFLAYVQRFNQPSNRMLLAAQSASSKLTSSWPMVMFSKMVPLKMPSCVQ